MKAATVQFDADTRQGQTTIARLLTVTRIPDGAVYYFTNHDQPLVVGGNTYISTTSFNSNNINSKLDGTEKDSEVSGAFDTVILRTDVLAGLWDGATFQLLIVNWKNIGHGTGILVTGTFGPFTVQEFGWKTTLRGLAFKLTFMGGDLCGPTCRADFGDSKCAPGGVLASGTNINSLLQAGSVSSSPDGYRTLVVTGITNLGFPLIGGLLTWTSGANANLNAEVMNIVFGSSMVTITLRPWTQISPVVYGDDFSLQVACDKVRTTCDYTYGNILNNQSEPDAPDPDATIEYPDYQAVTSTPPTGVNGTLPLGAG